jgi:hypothetical protein
MALLAGVTLGDPGGANWGSAYYGGQKVIGISAGQLALANGTFGPAATDADYQAIADAENANYNTQPAQDYRYQQAIDTSTNPAMQTVLRNPEWKALQGTGPINWASLSDTLKAQIQAVPALYDSLTQGLSTSATSVPATGATAPDTTQSTTGTAATSTVSRLSDLVASQYNGITGAVSGGGSSGSGGSGGYLSLSAPVPTTSANASTFSPVKVVLVLAVVAGVIYFIHRKSTKRAA